MDIRPVGGRRVRGPGTDVIKVEDVRGGDPGRSLVVSGLRRENARADRDFMMAPSP
ncbi:hypothetical protein [Streptomyces canus]|uniref:hypothetical protein n=1 Tax=Streptomyces canus TaxID=58343 RepID=UPI002E270334